MSSDLQRYGHSGHELRTSEARRATREIDRVERGGLVRTSRLDMETDLVMDKNQSITDCAGDAMQNRVRLNRLRSQLEMMDPGSTGDLSLLADTHLIGELGLMADHVRTISRI